MYLKTKHKSGQRIGKSAQVTLELTFSIICVSILLLACIVAFVWLNNCFVARQVIFEDTRNVAGIRATSSAGPVINEETGWNISFFDPSYPNLD